MHAGWDQHNSLTTELYTQCKDTDQPAAGLVQDLKQRGLLEDTLVIWGGEFGRTPFLQGNMEDRVRWGRDHHPYVFTLWMAGGGVKAGYTHGASDDLGIEHFNKLLLRICLLWHRLAASQKLTVACYASVFVSCQPCPH